MQKISILIRFWEVFGRFGGYKSKVKRKPFFISTRGMIGLHLGRGWDAPGRLLVALGRFLSISGAFKIELVQNINPKLAPRRLLDRFWVNIAKDLGGFREDLGRSWEDLGQFWDGFWTNWGENLEVR